MNSRTSQCYHREVSNFREHSKPPVKPNHFIGNHRILDELKTINKPSRKIGRNNEEAETEKISKKGSDKISFSHRAVVMRKAHPGLNAENERVKQGEINRLTNYFLPKVHKLNPSQISQSIIMRSKLAKLLPKKELQPKLYPRSSILMQKHLRLLKPCENYNKKRHLDKILDEPKKITSKDKPNPLKQRGMEGTRFAWKKTLENTPSVVSKSGFLEQAMKLVKQKQGASKEIMSPLHYMIKYAKILAKTVKSKER